MHILTVSRQYRVAIIALQSYNAIMLSMCATLNKMSCILCRHYETLLIINLYPCRHYETPLIVKSRENQTSVTNRQLAAQSLYCCLTQFPINLS